jgi:SAM-dependent methyltransferase
VDRQIAAWRREYQRPGRRRIESSYSLRPERCVARFRRFLARQGLRGGTLLDLGCGRGRNSLPWLRTGWQVTGLDSAPEALAEFRDLAAPWRERLRLRRGSFAQPLTFARDGVFDAVMEITAADNLRNHRQQQRLWRECARVLKPGGWLLSYHFTRQDGYYGPLLRRSALRRLGVLYDRQAGMWFRFYAAADILAGAGGKLEQAARWPYRYSGPMFGRRLVRDLAAAIFRRR